MNVLTPQLSDQLLIDQYINGCNQSMEELLFRHKDKLYSFIYTLVKDRFLADDLLQETYLRIIRSMKNGQYADQGKFLPWATRMAHNLCMDHFRKIKTKRHISLPDGSLLANWLEDKGLHQQEKMEQRQTCQSVRELVERLPIEQREVVVMRMYGELSFKEIASATGVSINTALGRMRYALLNLRKLIHEQGIPIR